MIDQPGEKLIMDIVPGYKEMKKQISYRLISITTSLIWC